MSAVNPHGAEADGTPCYAKVDEVASTVDGAILMVPDSGLDAAMRDCLAAGVPRLWISGAGKGRPISAETYARCREQGIPVINGYCPLMFLRSASWPHRFHGWVVQHSRAFKSAPV